MSINNSPMPGLGPGLGPGPGPGNTEKIDTTVLKIRLRTNGDLNTKE